MARVVAKRQTKAPAKKPAPVKSPVKQAAKRVAVDAVRVKVDVNQLLKSLDHLGVVALRQVAARAEALIDERSEGEKRTLIEEVTARAMSLGVSITDLFGQSKAKTGKAAKGGPAKRAGGTRASPPVKYRDPETGIEWSGRGRMAKRFAELVADGRDLKEFLVR